MIPTSRTSPHRISTRSPPPSGCTPSAAYITTILLFFNEIDRFVFGVGIALKIADSQTHALLCGKFPDYILYL